MPESTLISADNTWALWGVLTALAAFGLWSEKTRIGARLSGAIVAIVSAFLLANLSVIPSSSSTYDVVWDYLVPLAIPLLLFRADLRKIIRESGKTLVAFTIGGIGTVLGTILAFYLIPLGPDGWRLSAIFCSTYIGGSMNFVAASEAVQLRSGDLLAAGIAADNLMMTLYFLLLFALPSITVLRKLYPGEANEGTLQEPPVAVTGNTSSLDVTHIGIAIAISVAICAIGFTIADAIAIKGMAILIITALIVILATSFPGKIGQIQAADKIGTFLMHIFFVVIGAAAHIATVLKVGAILFVFAGLILLVHLIFLFVAGKILKLRLPELVIASNANMGGPTTAAAMAVARKWHGLVIPAILCGTLGYAIATFIGVAVGYALR